jgi:hypothetical protein
MRVKKTNKLRDETSEIQKKYISVWRNAKGVD